LTQDSTQQANNTPPINEAPQTDKSSQMDAVAQVDPPSQANNPLQTTNTFTFNDTAGYLFTDDGPTLTISHHEASAYRYRVTRAPDIVPATDPTIQKVLQSREQYVGRMVHAMWDLSTAEDSTYSRRQERNLFTLGEDHAFSAYDVEAACRVLFDIVIDRCQNGFRGSRCQNMDQCQNGVRGSRNQNLAEGNKATRRRNWHQEDTTANCGTRMENVISCLRKWKSACRDVMYEDSKMVSMANHPLACARAKMENKRGRQARRERQKATQAELDSRLGLELSDKELVKKEVKKQMEQGKKQEQMSPKQLKPANSKNQMQSNLVSDLPHANLGIPNVYEDMNLLNHPDLYDQDGSRIGIPMNSGFDGLVPGNLVGHVPVSYPDHSDFQEPLLSQQNEQPGNALVDSQLFSSLSLPQGFTQERHPYELIDPQLLFESSSPQVFTQEQPGSEVVKSCHMPNPSIPTLPWGLTQELMDGIEGKLERPQPVSLDIYGFSQASLSGAPAGVSPWSVDPLSAHTAVLEPLKFPPDMPLQKMPFDPSRPSLSNSDAGNQSKRGLDEEKKEEEALAPPAKRLRWVGFSQNN
jgi:hypothetical protein